MTYYDIELIDVSENIENFKFHRIAKGDLNKILNSFKKNEGFLEFSSMEGFILLKTDHIRGLMYQKYIEKEKNVYQENMESAKEVSQVKLKKTIFNSTPEIGERDD